MIERAKQVRLLGIDPGTATVGYGVIDSTGGGGPTSLKYIASGIIKTTNDFTAGVRLNIIRTDILSLIDEFKPDLLAIESIFFFKNAKTLVPVAQARGVIIEAATSRSVQYFEYTPMQVKLHLTGFGRADKRLVQEMIMKLLGLPEIIKPDDASDALAIAVCHARMAVVPMAQSPVSSSLLVAEVIS